jgi:hypothetical protein
MANKATPPSNELRNKDVIGTLLLLLISYPRLALQHLMLLTKVKQHFLDKLFLKHHFLQGTSLDHCYLKAFANRARGSAPRAAQCGPACGGPVSGCEILPAAPSGPRGCGAITIE